MSNRRAQDERIEGTPDGVNAITEIVDVPDAPTIGTATAGIGNASIAFTPATTGGTVSLFTATSTPDSITGTSATSPITVSGLTGGTEYTFTVRGSNSTGTSPESSSSNAVTPIELDGAYDALTTVTVPSGGAASVTFTGIPTGYKHLQARIMKKNGSAAWITGRINGDSASNYTYHELRGDGSSATSNASSGSGDNLMYMSLTENTVGSMIVDILDYTNTSKYKTLRTLSGSDANGAGYIQLTSNLWMSTSTINSITFTASFQEYSHFALYGVK